MAYKINKSQWTQLKASSGERMNNLNSKSNTTYNNQLGSVAF